jgi:hypothetical protein
LEEFAAAYHPIIREKAGRWRTSETRLEWKVGNYNATSCRLFNEENCGKVKFQKAISVAAVIRWAAALLKGIKIE